MPTALDRLHARVVRSRALQRFTAFTRVLLAFGFVYAGLRKTGGAQFGGADLSLPSNAFLEAFYRAPVLYAFVGWAQIVSGLLLLWPRTALLGVVVYTPIILNIVLINLSMEFGGTLWVTLLMLLACVYLLCWDYDRVKVLLPRREARAGRFGRSEYGLWAAAGAVAAAGALVGSRVVGYGWERALGGLPLLNLLLVAAVGAVFGLVVAWHVRRLPAPGADL